MPFRLFSFYAASVRSSRYGRLLGLLLFFAVPFFLLDLSHWCSADRLSSAAYPTGWGLIVSYTVLLLALIGTSLMTRRIWCAIALVGGIVFFLSVADWMSHLLRAAHFSAQMLVMADETGKITGFLGDLPMGPAVYAYLAALPLLSLAAGAFCPKLAASPLPRLAGALGCFGLIALLAAPGTVSRAVDSLCCPDAISLGERYNQQGFFYGFLSSFDNERDMQAVQTVMGENGTVQLAQLEDPTLLTEGDGVQPDVIVILSEAFWDLTKLSDCAFSEDPLKNYRAIAAQNPSGELVVSVFGGGTVNTEFEVLTGLTTNGMDVNTVPYTLDLPANTFSMASYFKQQGYDTVAVHPYDANFYNRAKGYPSLGFDEFVSQQELTVPASYSGPYISDETFLNQLEQTLDQQEEPTFLFGITMGNHGLYAAKFTAEEKVIQVQNSSYTPEELDIVEGATEGTRRADVMLGELYDYVQNRDRPTVVVVFGDHLPALSGGFSQYVSAGMVDGEWWVTAWSEEQRQQMYSSPYVVFSNYDTGHPYQADGEAISSYYLFPLLQDYIGAPQTALLNFLQTCYQEAPVYNMHQNLYTILGDRQTADNLAALQIALTSRILNP